MKQKILVVPNALSDKQLEELQDYWKLHAEEFNNLPCPQQAIIPIGKKKIKFELREIELN